MAEVDTFTALDKDNVAREFATTTKLLKSVGAPDATRVADTDGTPVTMISLLKQISYVLQNATSTTDKQDTIIAAINSLAPMLDGLEGLLGSNNSNNTAIINLLTANNSTNDLISGFVDGLEALFTTNNASNATVQGLLTDLKTQIILAANEGHIGAISGHTNIVDVVLTLDTVAYAANEVLAATQIVVNAMRVNGGTGILNSIQLLDRDANGKSIEIIILEGNSPIGVENAAVTIAYTSADAILGIVRFDEADYINLINSKSITKGGLGIGVKSLAGSKDLYIAAITRDIATFTANGIRVRLTFLQD